MIVNRVWLKKDVVHVVTFLALLSLAEDWVPARPGDQLWTKLHKKRNPAIIRFVAPFVRLQ